MWPKARFFALPLQLPSRRDSRNVAVRGVAHCTWERRAGKDAGPTKSAKAGKSKPRRAASPAAAAESDSDDEFASAQVRRALGGSAGTHRARLEAAAARNARAAPTAASAAAGAAARGAAALGAVETHVSALRERRARDERALQKTRGQLAAAIDGAQGHEAAFAAAGRRYTYLQELRAYLRDLCACLEHKAAEVEALEEARREVLRERRAAGGAERDEV